MNIREYLAEKYHVSTPTTITYREAKVLGIPYPLRRGWLAEYGPREISPGIARELAAVMTRRRRKDYSSGYADRGVKAAMRAERIAQWTPEFDPQRPDFLQSYEWRRVRMLALKKYGRKCQCCGATPASGALLNIDHIKPRAIFPELALSLDNLQVLCHECNHGKGNWDMTDWREQEA